MVKKLSQSQEKHKNGEMLRKIQQEVGSNLRRSESRQRSEKKQHRWDLLYESGSLLEKKRELVSQIF